MAKFGSKITVELDKSKSFGSATEALADKGYEFRFRHIQKNGITRDIYVAPDGQRVALFDVANEGPFFSEATFKVYID